MMKKYIHIVIIALLLNLSFNAYSQEIIHRTQGNEEIIMPEGACQNIDRLLSEWNSYKYLHSGDNCLESDVIPYYPDSVYINRLSKLPTTIEMPYNDVVRGCIDLYTVKLRKQVSYMLGAYNFYMPIFEDALSAMNMPLELKYLPMIESSLNPKALSRAGASGLWQFMIGTGRMYGLEVNTLLDERRDPIKATWAAVKYLKEMYDVYQDWHLVIAAYNCGAGTVNKAIKRAGGKNDYWAIYNYLPKETRSYVPIFIAANYIMNYYCEHNICPMKTDMPASTDTIMVSDRIHFKQIAEQCNISVEEIDGLNPQYLKQIIPGDYKECALRLPTQAISLFIEKKDEIVKHKANELFTNRKVIEVENISNTKNKVANVSNKTKNKSGANNSKSKNTIKHVVKKGETLSKIAAKYKVSVKDIQAWNGLKGANIVAGKSIIIKK